MRLTLPRTAFGLHANPFFLSYARRISKQSRCGRPVTVVVRTDDGDQDNDQDPIRTDIQDADFRIARSTSSIAMRPLPPQISSMKTHVEALIASSSTYDTVIFPKEGAHPGVTDLAIENRGDEMGRRRLVSIYFDSTTDGLRSYRQAAASLSACPEVELHYTPHLGQSRISIEWNDFWSLLSSRDDRLSLFSPQTLLSLPLPSTTD